MFILKCQILEVILSKIKRICLIRFCFVIERWQGTRRVEYTDSSSSSSSSIYSWPNLLTQIKISNI